MKATGGERLRVAWAGPMREGSAIGREGARIAAGLAARGHKVELVATDHEWSEAAPRIASDLPARHWSQLHLQDLATSFDSVVVNVGDHFMNHAGVFPLMAAAPCLAVVHDAFLGNLFNGWLWADGSRPGMRAEVMLQTYGAEGLELARRLEAGDLPLEEQAERAPMTEWVARRAAGCLAHSPFYVPRLLASCAGPVDVAGLPVASRGIAPLPDRHGRTPVAVTVGHMNPNKCADRVVEAIASRAELRDGLDYRLVGPIAPEESARLRALAARLGYRRLSIEGPASESELNAALDAADIIVALRRPVLEGASGSAIEALLAGRPTVVADAGFYAGLPDDVAVKVAADIPTDALAEALAGLAADPAARRAWGERARGYAEARFNLDAYLEVLEPLMRATAAAAPILRMGRGLGGQLADLGLGRDDPAVARIAETLRPLFAAQPASQGARSAAG